MLSAVSSSHPPTHSPIHPNRITCLPVAAPFAGHGHELEHVPALHGPNTHDSCRARCAVLGVDWGRGWVSRALRSEFTEKEAVSWDSRIHRAHAWLILSSQQMVTITVI